MVTRSFTIALASIASISRKTTWAWLSRKWRMLNLGMRCAESIVKLPFLTRRSVAASGLLKTSGGADLQHWKGLPAR